MNILFLLKFSYFSSISQSEHRVIPWNRPQQPDLTCFHTDILPFTRKSTAVETAPLNKQQLISYWLICFVLCTFFLHHFSVLFLFGLYNDVVLIT